MVFICFITQFVDLLRETSKPEAKAAFSNVSSFPQSVDSGRISPSHGFQRDLVRVIGNMCYQHFPNQEKVIELSCFLAVSRSCCFSFFYWSPTTIIIGVVKVILPHANIVTVLKIIT